MSDRAPVGHRIGSQQVAASPCVKDLVRSGTSNFDPVETTARAAPAGRCVDRAASQRAGSTATTPSLTSRRCAPSPCATRAPIPHSASCSPARCLDSIFADPPWPCVVRRRRRFLRVNGGMVPPDEPALRQARASAQLPGQLEIGPLPAPPARRPLTVWLDLRSQAPPRARRSAPAASALRPPPWASSRAPSPPRPLARGERLAQKMPRAVRVAMCRAVRGRTLPPPPRSWPGLAPTSPTTHSAPFGALAQAAAPSQHRRSAAAACRDRWPRRPLGGPYRLYGPPDRRGGGQRGPRCRRQCRRHAWSACRALGGRRRRREAASRAALELPPGVRSRRREMDAVRSVRRL